MAFYSNDSSKGQKGGSSSKKEGKCHNCGKKGHWKKDCWQEGGGKEGQGPKQKAKKEKDKGKGKDTAAAAKEDKKDKPKEGQSKDEEAWMAMVMCDISDGDYSGLDEAHCNDFHAEAYSCFIEDDLHTIFPSQPDVDMSETFDGSDEVLATDQ